MWQRGLHLDDGYKHIAAICIFLLRCIFSLIMDSIFHKGNKAKYVILIRLIKNSEILRLRKSCNTRPCNQCADQSCFEWHERKMLKSGMTTYFHHHLGCSSLSNFCCVTILVHFCYVRNVPRVPYRYTTLSFMSYHTFSASVSFHTIPFFSSGKNVFLSHSYHF